MGFVVDYQSIKNIVKSDMDFLESEIGQLFKDDNPLMSELSDFLLAPSKRIRPLLGMLFIKALMGSINPPQMDLLLAVELIHSATLIHDDVIDESEIRRSRETINKKFDSSLAVIAGDFLLSTAMEKVINADSLEVIKLCTSSLKRTCFGEINQYFNKFKVVSIQDYIDKSRDKTALLFELAVFGGLLLSETSISQEINAAAKEFAQNFGIAFQIRDDLLNVKNNGLEAGFDIESGIYTAPVIFACEENNDLLVNKNFEDVIKNTIYIEKTKDLMDNYFDKAVSAIESFENNKYKQAIKDLVNVLSVV